MNITTDQFLGHPRAVLVPEYGQRITAMIRPGETPLQALERVRDYWRGVARNATINAIKYERALTP